MCVVGTAASITDMSHMSMPLRKHNPCIQNQLHSYALHHSLHIRETQENKLVLSVSGIKSLYENIDLASLYWVLYEIK